MSHLILVVEEDPVLGDFLSTALEDEGYVAHVVSNSEHALQVIEASPPALILLHYCPLGRDLLRSTHTISIIMYSTIEASLAEHSHHKPFDLNTLLALVASSLPSEREVGGLL